MWCILARDIKTKRPETRASSSSPTVQEPSEFLIWTKYYGQKQAEFETLHQDKIQRKQCSIFQVTHNVTSKIGKGLRLALDHGLEVHSIIWWNLGIQKQKTVTVPRIWSPEDPNFKYPYETKPACKGRHIQSLAVSR